jgi:hypothetical protein
LAAELMWMWWLREKALQLPGNISHLAHSYSFHVWQVSEVINIVSNLCVFYIRSDGKLVEFDLPAHLTSSDRERDYLRRVSERCIALFFPPNYVENSPVKHLLREILACKGMCYIEL